MSNNLRDVALAEPVVKESLTTDREPVADLTTLDNLDSRDLVSGYFAGFSGDGHEPSVEMDCAYYHGWLNGMCDKGRMQPSATHKQLIHEWHKREKNK